MGKQVTHMKCYQKCQIDEPNNLDSWRVRTILGPRNSVQVKVDAETIFTCPTDKAKDVSSEERSAIFL